MKNKSQKGQKGKKGTVGAPPKVIKFPLGKFTYNEAFGLNPSVCDLTVRKRVDDAVASGQVVQLAETVKKDGVGRPSYVFILKSVLKTIKKATRARKAAAKARKAASKSRKAKKAKTVVKVTSPAVVPVADVTPSVETPVVQVTVETAKAA